MNKKTLSLKAFLQALIEAVMYADDKMQSAQIREKSLLASINPLRTAGIRVSFEADILNENGDLFLDFNKSDRAFKGEIIFKSNNIEMVFEKNEK